MSENTYGQKDPNETEGVRGDDAQSVAREFLGHVGSRIKNFAGRMRAETLQETVRNTTTKVADGLESAGGYLEEQKFENVVNDVGNVIRRYPIQSVLIGLTVGIFLARRSGK